MDFEPTLEQLAIINAPLGSFCVTACPGSGKTATAVRRLIEIRKRMGHGNAYPLLLSFSNVAIETFRKQYEYLARKEIGLSPRVTIDTIDGLLTSLVLRPHAARTMQSSKQPFLVDGHEDFLYSMKVWDGTRPREIAHLVFRRDGKGDIEYIIREKTFETIVAKADALNAINKLGKVGGYTHEIGRYWALKTLATEPKLLLALAKRFPHIIVDEAQDVGPLHESLLKLLAKAGSTVTVIGDPNQAIYEFAYADGTYLRRVSSTASTSNVLLPLTQNRRSIPEIITTANLLANTTSIGFREPGNKIHGVFYIAYDSSNPRTALDIFISILANAGYETHEAAILCRGAATVAELNGDRSGMGKGGTAFMIESAIQRDQKGDITQAFNRLVISLLRLLENPSPTLKLDLLSNTGGENGSLHLIRRRLWEFLRGDEKGLPNATLKGLSEWFPKAKENVEKLLNDIETLSELKRSRSWFNNFTRGAVEDKPIYERDIAAETEMKIRVDTVHKAKGESIPAVFYMASSKGIAQLLAGTHTEEGRIGYVAATRAKDLLILGVPKTLTSKSDVISAIEAKGFVAWKR